VEEVDSAHEINTTNCYNSTSIKIGSNDPSPVAGNSTGSSLAATQTIISTTTAAGITSDASLKVVPWVLLVAISLGFL
jgi:hypothetical protein